MFRFIALLLFTFTLFGCTKTEKCDIIKAVSAPIARTMTTFMNCEAPLEVQKSVEQWLGAGKVCDEITSKGLIGDAVCEPIVNEIMFAVKVVPEQWKCFGGKNPSELRDYLLDKCKKAI